MTLSIAVSLYCCIKKYPAKQKHLLPFHDINIKLKELDINNVLIKMESDNELEEVSNKNRTCCYFDEFDFIFMDEKSCKNI